MIHSIWVWIILAFGFLGVTLLIAKKWFIPARGFTQLALFGLSEITFICNKGVPCSNCPLSFGICLIGTTQRLAFIRQFPFYVTLILIAITGLVFGTLSCGWACPVGFIQDIFHAPRLREIKVPDKLKVSRYPALFLSVLLLFLELRFNFFSRRGIGVFHEITIIGGILLLATAIFTKRPFCRLFCPLGLIYGTLNKISHVRIVLDRDKCSACGECSKLCISDLNPVKEVNGGLCAKCFNCVKACRKKEWVKCQKN